MTERTAVYRICGAGTRLLYVGVSGRLLARIAQHADEKDWWTDVRSIAVTWYEDRVTALKAERDAIASENPVHNSASGHQSPGCGSTPNRIIRLREEWDDLGELVGKRKRGTIIRELVQWYLRYPGVKQPVRPDARDWEARHAERERERREAAERADG